MSMTFSLHENLNFDGVKNRCDFTTSSNYYRFSDDTHLFAEKLETPTVNNYVQRARLDEVLTKSVEKFGATLISGRAGTGKTALAANFAMNYREVAWFRVDSADANWNVFSRYFAASVEHPTIRTCEKVRKTAPRVLNPTEVSHFVENKISEISLIQNIDPMLIVLDDIHHIYDADWFEEFFTALIYSLTPDIHLLMLSRGTPALPLWRLRSKQVLGVIDEKLLAFNLEETTELFERSGRSSESAPQAFIKSFGRISRLKNIVETV